MKKPKCVVLGVGNVIRYRSREGISADWYDDSATLQSYLIDFCSLAGKKIRLIAEILE